VDDALGLSFLLCIVMVLGTAKASSKEVNALNNAIDDITVAGTYAGSVIVEAPAPLVHHPA